MTPKAAFPRIAVTPLRLFLCLALAAIVLPALFDLAKWGWSTEAGAHGPIVLATGLWLIWHDRALLTKHITQTFWPAMIALTLALVVYGLARITKIVALEGAAALLICVLVAVIYYGPRVIMRFWFHILYLSFILTPPENWIFVATRPIKEFLSASAVHLMSALGMNISGTASNIMIDSYQLQVAAACSGVNSLIGITAIGLFYVYVIRGSEPRYAAILLLMLVPLAIFTNFIRVVALIYIIHLYGDGAIFAFVHETGGLGMFMIAILLLFAIDSFLYPIIGKMRQGAPAKPSTVSAASHNDLPSGSLGRRGIMIGVLCMATATLAFARLPRRQVVAIPDGDIANALPTNADGWISSANVNLVLAPEDERKAAAVYDEQLPLLYSKPGQPDIMLMLAYARWQSAMLMVHRPESCYPGSGFTITQNRAETIPLAPGFIIPGRFLTAQLGSRIEQILYWTRLGNEFPNDWDQERNSLALQNLRGIEPDGALMRISIVSPDADAAFLLLRNFATSLYKNASDSGRALLAGPSHHELRKA